MTKHYIDFSDSLASCERAIGVEITVSAAKRSAGGGMGKFARFSPAQVELDETGVCPDCGHADNPTEILAQLESDARADDERYSCDVCDRPLTADGDKL